jgi:hypothetical protein
MLLSTFQNVSWRVIYRPPLLSSDQSSWLLKEDVLCFLWGTNWIYICYVEGSRPPLWSSGQSSWLPKEDVLCFLWGTNWIYICYVEESRLPLWSSGQSFWLQIQRSWFDSRSYQIFWGVMSLERSLLSLVGTIEELIEIKSSSSSLETREYGRRFPPHWSRGNLYPQKLVLISPKSGGRSVGIVLSRTQATLLLHVMYLDWFIEQGQIARYSDGILNWTTCVRFLERKRHLVYSTAFRFAL